MRVVEFYGITFYYDEEEVELTDEVINTLADYALEADDEAYTVLYENGRLVIL